MTNMRYKQDAVVVVEQPKCSINDFIKSFASADINCTFRATSPDMVVLGNVKNKKITITSKSVKQDAVAKFKAMKGSI